MKKLLSIFIIIALLLSAGCQPADDTPETDTSVYNIGICNYVDDASLNQIIANIESQLKVLAVKNGVTFNVKVENCNLDANVLSQIITNFSDMDLMVGVATPVAIAMRNATEDTGMPVVFAAVSDPVGSGLADSMQASGNNLTGTSDYLDTNAIMNLIFALNPDLDKVGLLYDVGQDGSTAAIARAKEYLNSRNITIVEKTGTNVSEVMLAVQALIDSGCKVIFTPTDNTIMNAELSIYETLAEAGVQQYCGADSFALNGAFLGYGVDYANLGRETAEMICDILIHKKDISAYPIRTFDNGIATVNTETCKQLGLTFEEVSSIISPYCSRVQPIKTAKSFD
ncbi:MAG: ABC transporter substrate-binding protein [Erysipelotrichaceae bacterium]|nr:ABC transporter substrate-binding protein [Erysipelotrichaceae bacterium]